MAWKKSLRIFLFSIIGFLLLLNLFQTWQWAHGVLDRTRMTKEYYFATFFSTTASETDRKLLLIDRPTEANVKLRNEDDYQKRTAIFLDFEDRSNENLRFSTDTAHSGKSALRMDNGHSFSPGFEAEFTKLTKRDHAWIRAGLWVFPLHEVTANTASLVITFEHNGESYAYSASGIDLPEYQAKAGKWNYISLDYLTPEVRSVNDKVKVYFWLQGNNPVLIDDLKVEIFN